MNTAVEHYRARAKFLTLAVDKFSLWDWIMSCYDFSRAKSILEIDCEAGDFWTHFHSNPVSLEKITLTDSIEEMLHAAKETLANSPLYTKMNFDVVDAETMTYADQSFDVVLAHHFMVHPLKSVPQALQQIARVMRKDGWVGIATLNMRTVREILGLANKIDSRFPPLSVSLQQFDEKVADKLLPKYFTHITKYSDETIIKIMDSDVIMAFIRTHPVALSLGLKDDFFTAFKSAVDAIIAKHGFFETAFTPTLYICKGPIK